MPEIGICRYCGRKILYHDIDVKWPDDDKMPFAQGGIIKVHRSYEVLEEGDPSCSHYLIIRALEEGA